MFKWLFRRRRLLKKAIIEGKEAYDKTMATISLVRKLTEDKALKRAIDECITEIVGEDST